MLYRKVAKNRNEMKRILFVYFVRFLSVLVEFYHFKRNHLASGEGMKEKTIKRKNERSC